MKICESFTISPRICTYLVFIWTILHDAVSASVIWRCPDFNLLHCKAIPPTCVSFRMIYIRHGDMECPGCLICADHVVRWVPPPTEISVTSSIVNTINPKRRKKLRRKEKERKKRQRKKIKLRRQKRREKKERKRHRKQMKKMERQKRKRKSNANLTTDIG